jgi:hypothetical protein
MKERPASEGRSADVAPPPLRCAVQGFAPLRRLESNCGGVWGEEEVQESVGERAEEWHFTLRERSALTRMTFPLRRQLQ